MILQYLSIFPDISSTSGLPERRAHRSRHRRGRLGAADAEVRGARGGGQRHGDRGQCDSIIGIKDTNE